MNQPGEGIDLSRSGWTNPDGFERDPRPNVPAPAVPKVCGDIGPDGWECEYRPGHKPVERHWADNGEPGGTTWERSLIDISTYQEMNLPEEQRPTIQGRITAARPGVEPSEDSLLRDMNLITNLAAEAIKAPNPAAWAVALEKIRGIAQNA
jgi:hypothetical protein